MKGLGMAAVNELSYKIIGDQGDTKTLVVYFPATVTVTQMLSFSDDFAPLLDAVIDGVIQTATIKLAVTLPGGLRTTPVATSDVHEGALLTFDVASTTFAFSHYIPTWRDYSDDQVNLAGTGVGAFITELEDGDGTISPSDRYANDLLTNTAATKVNRK
jgi:hypothetical protein